MANKRKHLKVLRLPDGSSIPLSKLRAAALMALAGDMVLPDDDTTGLLNTPIVPMTDDEKQIAAFRAEFPRNA